MIFYISVWMSSLASAQNLVSILGKIINEGEIVKDVKFSNEPGTLIVEFRNSHGYFTEGFQYTCDEVITESDFRYIKTAFVDGPVIFLQPHVFRQIEKIYESQVREREWVELKEKNDQFQEEKEKLMGKVGSYKRALVARSNAYKLQRRLIVEMMKQNRDNPTLYNALMQAAKAEQEKKESKKGKR